MVARETMECLGIASSSSAEIEMPLTFSLFNNLPFELRYLVWTFALPGPRVVYLEAYRLPWWSCYRVCSDISIEDIDAKGRPSFVDNSEEISELEERALMEEHLLGPRQRRGLQSRCAPPALLFVCHESRNMAVQSYTRAFGTFTGDPRVWINFDVDAIYMDWGLKRNSFCYLDDKVAIDDACLIKRLIVRRRDTSSPITREDFERDLAELLEYFPNLWKLTLVDLEPLCELDQGAELVIREPIASLVFTHKCVYTTFDGATNQKFEKAAQITHIKKIVESIDKQEYGLHHGLTLPEIEFKVIATPTPEGLLQILAQLEGNFRIS